MIYEYFKTEDHMSTVYGYNDVSDLEWMGGRKKQDFCNYWDHIMDNLEEDLSANLELLEVKWPHMGNGHGRYVLT